MNSELFLKTHRENWERLKQILEQISQKGPASLSQADLKSLGTLFRRVTADLAYARTNYPDHEMIDYLNNLVVKAHGNIFRRETLGLRQVGDFFRRGFPQLVVQQWRFIFVAGAVLLLGVIIGFFLHYSRPALDGLIIPDSMKNAISEGLSRGQVGAHWDEGYRPAISALIMVNNIKVGLLSFALGVAYGLGTVIVLLYNGLMMGVLGAVFTAKGYALDFWSLILPHGVLELLAIFICGGAGLALAKAVVKPGDYKRRDAMQVQGRIALKLVLGTLPMFFVAALIEGFVTPSLLPSYGKFAVAALSMLLFLLYIYSGSRGNRVKSPSLRTEGPA